MSGFCSRVSQTLCRGYEPLPEEETVVSEDHLTRKEVRERVAQALAPYLLPPLADIVSEYAIGLRPDLEPLSLWDRATSMWSSLFVEFSFRLLVRRA